MSDPGRAALIPRFVLDVGLWFFVPSVFLAAYTSAYHGPVEAIAPHLYVVALLYLFVVLVRLLVRKLIPRRPAEIISGLVLSAVVCLLWTYYALVLIGLASWGKVISWDLIRTYASQLPMLAQTLDFSLPIAAMALALVYALIVAVMLGYVARLDWTGIACNCMSRAIGAFAAMGGVAFLALGVHQFMAAPPVHEREPLSLTCFPALAKGDFQGHEIDKLRARRFDHADAAARAAYPAAPPENARNVVLIVVDALRPDHLSAYGYARDTTPYLRHLVKTRGASVVRDVYAACGDSSCGLLALATSKFAHQFGTRPITLQEVLRGAGYRVEMILSGDHTNFYGLRDLYGEVDAYYDASMAGPGAYLNDDRIVLDRVEHLPVWNGRPTMLQFHLMSAHILGRREPESLRFRPAENYSVLGRRAAGVACSAVESAINYYDNGVVQTDVVIGRLLSELEKKDYLGNALVVITADHGESLGEHGKFAHANSVYEHVLRVPLLFVPFGYRFDRAPDPSAVAHQVDIAPTVLAELGLSAPTTWAGTALQAPAERHFAYFQQHDIVGLIDLRDPGRRWKFVREGGAGIEAVYDLTSDPQERTNLLESAPPAHVREWRQQVLLISGGAEIRPSTALQH